MSDLLKRIKKLQQERGELVQQARALIDTADTEKRAMSADENNRCDDLMNKANDKAAEIRRLEGLVEQERQVAEHEAELERGGNDNPESRGGGGGTTEEQRQLAQMRGALHSEWREGTDQLDDNQVRQLHFFSQALSRGANSLTPEQRQIVVPSEAQIRALSYDIDTAGGYLAPPEQWVNQLLKNVDDETFMLQLANVMTLNGAHSLGVPTLDNDPADADWTSELETGSEDSTMSFGKRALTPHPLAKRLKISNKLLRNGALPAEAIARQRLAYKFGITFEKGLLTGDGNEKPLGVFTASSDGISTGRDVATDNASTAFTADGLINALMSIKGQYHKNCTWLFHRDGVKMAMKLKDGNGQYIWSMGLKGLAPDTLLNIPLKMSEYVPNTFTTGQYVGIVGDFSKYWVIINLVMTVQRLVELYAETNQTGLIGRMEADGMPVIEEAFARVKLG